MGIYLHRAKNDDEFIAGAFGQSVASSGGYDQALSTVSNNAVENRVIATAVNNVKVDVLKNKNDIAALNAKVTDVDETPTENSDKFVTSGGVWDFLNSFDPQVDGDTITVDEQHRLKAVIDENLSDSSTRSVQNKAVKEALDTKLDTINEFSNATVEASTPLVSTVEANGTAIDGEVTTVGSVYGYCKNQFSDTPESPTITEIDEETGEEIEVDNPEAGRAFTTGGAYTLREELSNRINELGEAFIFRGNVEDVASLPSLDSVRAGDVYNIGTADTTTEDFVEGAGVEIKAGTDVVAVSLDDGMKWDLLSNPSLYQTKHITPITVNETEVNTVEGALSALNDFVETKQDELTFDETPTRESENPVTSGGIYNALQRIDTTVVEDVQYLPEQDINNHFYRTPDGKLYVGNSEDETTTKVGGSDIFVGTRAEWEALTDEEKDEYVQANITDESYSNVTVDTVTEGNMNPVSSNAVALTNADIEDKISETNDRIDTVNETITAMKANIGDVVSGSYTFASSANDRWKVNKTFTLPKGVWNIEVRTYSNHSLDGRCAVYVGSSNGNGGYSASGAIALVPQLDGQGGVMVRAGNGSHIEVLRNTTNTIYCRSDSESVDYVNNSSGYSVNYTCTKIANL